MFQDFPVLENATINFKDFQVFQDPHGPCCIDRLISRSKQNRESLTYLASHCNERLLRIRKVSVTASDVKKYWEKKSISSQKVAKIFRNAEKFIDIGECTGTVKHTNVTIPAKCPAYQQRVSCRYAERSPLQFVLLYWNLPPRVDIWQATGQDVSVV